MINYGVLFCYGLLPFIVTNSYYPIFEGQLVAQSILVAFGICLYSALYTAYTDFTTKKNMGFREFTLALFLPLVIIFPLVTIYMIVLYALYYSLALKVILLISLHIWFIRVYNLKMENDSLSNTLYYKIAGICLLIAIHMCIIIYMSVYIVTVANIV
jgi:hypothetical protein